MSNSILQRYRAEILDLATRNGAMNVRVFGSLARGEGREDSDLDLLVTLGEGCSFLDLIRLKQDLENCTVRGCSHGKELVSFLRDRVLSEAIPL